MRKILGSVVLILGLCGFYPLAFGANEKANPVVTLTATIDVTDETASQPGMVTVTRSGDISAALSIDLDVKGAAKAGVDYLEIPRIIVIPEGKTSASIVVQALSKFDQQPSRTVIVSLRRSSHFQNGKPDSATVTIKESSPELFVATLRPSDDAPESTAYGTATLLLAPDRSRARVTVGHANLSSPLVSSHLKLGTPGHEGSYLINFPAGQNVSFEWAMQPTGQFTAEALRTALERGQIYVALDTKNHPTGEVRGTFIHVNGSEKFQAPAPAPKLSAEAPTPRDVARFLTQATFGPKKSEIDDFLHPPVSPNQPPPKPMTFDGWINEQMAIPASSHLETMRADFRAFPPTSPRPRINNTNRQNAWWQLTLTAPDQLRQRVAFALSEIFVVSDVNGTLANNSEGATAYYDLLARDAFGNFRQLLEDVTLHPVMGAYLSHLKSPKADEKRGTSADENYAREVMQLFTIGLNELQPDGTYRLGKDGRPIPTYDQNTVVETAKIFTGWGFYSAEPRPNFFGARANFCQPMILYPEQHDDGPKTLVGGIKLPAKQGGAADLRIALDTLFNHPNTGPFICRQLIQRLVTSNPSPGYVYRVSQVFAHNGHGERGDLGAVIRAILLDYEARSPDVLHNVGYGKLKEPLLQATALLRAFDATSSSGRCHFPNPEASLGEAALHSPTVFNFYEPNYVLPGPLAAAGLYAPEYQILTDTTAISIPNQLRNFIHTPARPNENTLVLKLDSLLALAQTPDDLITYLDLVFCAGALSDHARKVVADTLTNLPPATTDLERARTALDLVVTSPEAAVQR
jgi:uncharacterized protein (DUF1800 family)